MTPESLPEDNLVLQCEDVMNEIFARCTENAPNFGVRENCLKDSFQKNSQPIFVRNVR